MPIPLLPPSSTTKRKRAADTAAPPNEAYQGRPPESKPSAVQVIQLLLSPAALNPCRPEDETKDIQTHGDEFRIYYSSKLNSFKELMCAVVLTGSSPHECGLKRIRTIFNEPHEFTPAKAVHDAGSENWQQAVSNAPNEHYNKTAK
ncbi:hypothetical protein W97_06342 [Coniosporium apollinis CBS 100218]|uniref:Uncharacterized protein n=1 Tax=Coniosporium apollinis (strain CBS 100218) TaxID=1168221 RepID=R7YZA0_CONA1|nr:uncharacterized protein W97_06342 [Coniosporium apollinis CBS 100218]EON67089.1 hypothetical protein W97_06342 [Coniosporium apollinis CBS 100218]